MTARVWPVAAVAGAPAYDGRSLRQTTVAVPLAGATAARPFAVRSGVRPGTSTTTVTATTTQWTVGEHAGVIDAEPAVEAGPYAYSFDANVTGTMTAASASYARIDLISVQISDPAESDGSSTPSATIVYTPGTAAAPALPTQPARSMVIAQINVPISGGGSPSVTWVAPYLTAPGGIIPVRNQAERDAITYSSAERPVYVDRLDTGNIERNSGSGWSIITWGGAWSTYSPSYVNLTLGTGGTISGRWRQIGSTIDVYIVLTFGSSGFAIGGAYIGIPVQSGTVDAGGLLGYGEAYHVSGPAWWPLLATASGSTFQVISAASGTSMTDTAPFTVAASDRIEMRLRYEV